MNICLLRHVHPQRFHFHLPKVVSWETGIQSGPDSLETISYTMAAMRMFSHASSQPSGSFRCPPLLLYPHGSESTETTQRASSAWRFDGVWSHTIGDIRLCQPKGLERQTGGGPPDTHRPPARAGADARTLRGCWMLTSAGQFPVLPALLMNVLAV